MKSKEILLFIFCCYLSLSINGQDTINKKHQFFFDIGGNYNYFYGNRYVDSLISLTNVQLIYPSQDFAGYTIMPASGIHLGLMYDLTLRNKFIFEFGLLFNNRRLIYESDTNKLRLYKKVHNPEYENVIKYDVSTNNIETQIDFGFYYRRFIFYAGTRIFIRSFATTRMTYINGDIKKKKDIKYYFYNDLFPELKLCYSIPIKCYSPQIYIGINKSLSLEEFKKSIFLEYGIKIPFFKT